MFRKLLKYEWKAMMRTMLPIYGAALAVAAINGFLIQSVLVQGIFGGRGKSPLFLQYTQTATMTLYILIMAAMGVFTAVMIIQRFYKGLLRQEGYLMFTLPVKTWQLIFSKACVSFAVAVCSMAVGLFSLGLFGGAEFFRAIIQIPGLLVDLIREGYSSYPGEFTHGILFLAELTLAMIAGTFASIYELYFSMALGQLSRNHKIIFSVLWFVGISTVLNFAGMVSTGNMALFMDISGRTGNEMAALHVLGLGILGVQAVSLAVLMAGTGYVLDRRLNLE